jgi:hypothetical protein
MDNVTNLENVFAGYYEWDRLKFFSVIWQLSLIFVGSCILGSIVWYENRIVDFKYQSFLNYIMSQFCIIQVSISSLRTGV